MEAEQTFSFLGYKVYLVDLVISSCLGARKHIFVCECESDRDSDITLGWIFNEIVPLRFSGEKSSTRPVMRKIALTLSKWRPFHIFQKHYVLIRFFLSNHTKRKMVSNSTISIHLVLFLYIEVTKWQSIKEW